MYRLTMVLGLMEQRFVYRVTVVPVLMYGAEVCVQGHCGASVNVRNRGMCTG